jgi:hypothetical protein
MKVIRKLKNPSASSFHFIVELERPLPTSTLHFLPCMERHFLKYYYLILGFSK